MVTFVIIVCIDVAFCLLLKWNVVWLFYWSLSS